MRFSTSFRRWYRDDVVLRLGSHAVTREQLVRQYQCCNFRAAQLLDAALASLKITTIAGLTKTTPDALLKLDGIGERTIFVATCILDAAGADVLAWLNADEHRHKRTEPLAFPIPPPPTRRRARAA